MTFFHTPITKTAARIVSVRRRKGDDSMRIDLLFFRDKIRRVLVITSERLRGLLRMSRRIELPEVSRPADTQQVMRDARAELLRLSERGSHRLREQTLDSARAESDTVNAAVRRMTPVAATVANTSSPGKADKPAKMTEVVGILSAFGRDKREMHHGKVITHFYVDITIDEEAGIVTRLWGIDLQRAMAEAKAVAGDRVQVRDFGLAPCIVPERIRENDGSVRLAQKTVDKRLFSIEKVK